MWFVAGCFDYMQLGGGSIYYTQKFTSVKAISVFKSTYDGVYQNTLPQYISQSKSQVTITKKTSLFSSTMEKEKADFRYD